MRQNTGKVNESVARFISVWSEPKTSERIQIDSSSALIFGSGDGETRSSRHGMVVEKAPQLTDIIYLPSSSFNSFTTRAFCNSLRHRQQHTMYLPTRPTAACSSFTLPGRATALLHFCLLHCLPCAPQKLHTPQ